MTQLRLSAENQRALMLQLNAEIECAAERSAAALVSGTIAGILAYPPNCGFTEEERAALEKLRDIPAVEAVIRKVIADASAAAAFHLLASIDGVGDPDPNFGKWTGVVLIDRPENSDDIVADELMLHVALSDEYWRWRDMRPKKGWFLDTYQG